MRQMFNDESGKLSPSKVLAFIVVLIIVIPLVYIGALKGDGKGFIFNCIVASFTFVGTLLGVGQVRTAAIQRKKLSVGLDIKQKTSTQTSS